MGIRPHLYFGVALQVEREPGKWHPKGWPENWQDIEVFGPTEEQIEAAWERMQTAHMEEDYDLYEYILDIDIARHFAELKDNERKLSEFVAYDAEFGFPDVALYVVDHTYSDDFLYALASIHQEYNHRCFVELPKIATEDDYSLPARAFRAAQAGRTYLRPLVVEGYARLPANTMRSSASS